MVLPCRIMLAQIRNVETCACLLLKILSESASLYCMKCIKIHWYSLTHICGVLFRVHWGLLVFDWEMQAKVLVYLFKSLYETLCKVNCERQVFIAWHLLTESSLLYTLSLYKPLFKVDLKSNFVTSWSRLLHVKLPGSQVKITISSNGCIEIQQCQGDAFRFTALTCTLHRQCGV